MGETTVTQIDERGRLVVPAAVRRALNVDDTSADVRIEIEVIECHGKNE